MAAILQKSETREKRRLAMPKNVVNLGTVVKVNLKGPNAVEVGSNTYANARCVWVYHDPAVLAKAEGDVIYTMVEHDDHVAMTPSGPTGSALTLSGQVDTPERDMVRIHSGEEQVARRVDMVDPYLVGIVTADGEEVPRENMPYVKVTFL